MILLCISLILDGYLSSFIPSNSILLPKLTITAIYYLHQKYKKKPTTEETKKSEKSDFFIYIKLINIKNIYYFFYYFHYLCIETCVPLQR